MPEIKNEKLKQVMGGLCTYQITQFQDDSVNESYKLRDKKCHFEKSGRK